MSILDAPSVSPTQFNQLLQINNIAALTDGDLSYAPFLNVARYTEDLTWTYCGVSGSAAKAGVLKKAISDGRFITLSQITSSTFNDSVFTTYFNAGLAPFQAGQKYLVSMYVYSERDKYFYMRPVANSGSQGHGIKLSKAGKLRRVWALGQATDTSRLDLGANAAVALGLGTPSHPTLYQQGYAAAPAATAFFIGGIQLESVPPETKDGIAWQGDSTMAGASGGIDIPRDYTDPNSLEVSTVVSSILNAPCYNRAVGGDTLANMDSRWAADITPLRLVCKYVIIQGGINDITQGRTIEQMKASLQSMIAKAATDGFLVKILTCTPTTPIATTPGKEIIRVSFNEWIMSTYPGLAIDIAPLVTNTSTGNTLKPEFYGDGVHYPGVAKITIGRYIAKNSGMVLPKPSTYHRQQA